MVETAVASVRRWGGAWRVAAHEEHLLQGWTAASLAWSRHLRGEAGSGNAAEEGNEKLTLRCGPCFHLLHQQVYLLGLDPTAAAAPQTKVATTKVQAESRRAAAAQSGVPSSKPPGRKGIQLAQMAATKHASIFYFTSSHRVRLY